MEFPSEEKYTDQDTGLLYYQDQIYKDLKTIFTFENIYFAFKNAKRGKRNKKEVYEFEKNFCQEIRLIQNEILSGNYKISELNRFTIFCKSTGKIRNIAAPKFRDLVVQHVIYNHVYPLFDKRFIFDSYGCRKTKGTHKASNRCQKYLRKHDEDLYYIQMDIRKYYLSINHEKLFEILARTVTNKSLLNLMMLFVNNEDKIGLHIGNLLSQLYGLIYLDKLDHFIKRKLKCKHYIRYVDDFVIIGKSKERANEIKEICEKFLSEELNLKLSKWKISKIKNGINFVGFRTWQNKKLVRKRSLNNFNRYLKNKNKLNSINSLIAHSKHTSSFNYFKRKLKEHDIFISI